MPARLLATTPLQPLANDVFSDQGVRLWCKREDLRHPLFGGNKWHKLQGHLRLANAQKAKRIISFGGAWSNHLHALAGAGKAFGIDTVGLVRGDAQTAMLDDCRAYGMTVRSLSHGEYRRRYDQDFLAALQAKYPDAYFIPEGGAGDVGLEGFADLADELDTQINALGLENCVVAVAMGTGTTFAGLRRYLPKQISVWGFPVLPLGDIETARISEMVNSDKPMRIWQGLVDTKYGQLTTELKTYLEAFEAKQGVQLDPIYTVKLLFALEALAQTCHLSSYKNVIAIHSGGLQGRRGFDLPFSNKAAF